MRKTIVCLLVSCLLSGMIPYAAAAEQEAAYNGYIVRLDTQSCVSLLSDELDLPDGLEEICASDGLYKVDDPDVVAELEEDGMLAYAEPNYVVTLEDVPVLQGNYQWYLWHLDTIGEIYAQDNNITGKTASGERIRVGVIDSGLYAEHYAFKNMDIEEGTNYCASEGSASRSDTSDTVMHGTFVTGLIAAGLGTGAHAQGIAPDVTIVPLKCFDDSNGDIATIVEAIHDAVDVYHCQVLNMSFGVVGSLDNLTSLTEAIDYAADNGIIMVAAVGNLSSGSSSGNDSLQYPAAYDSVVGVGSVNSNKVISDFSYQNESVFVTAPGEYVYGAGISSANSTSCGSGTSYSTPMVTAAAALALSVDPSLSPSEFMEILSASAEDLGPTGYDNAYGYGMLRVDNLLKTMLEGWFVTGNNKSGYTVSAWRQGLEQGQEVQVAEVGYDDAGKMVGIRILKDTKSEDGSMSIRNLSLDKIDGATRLKLMILQPDSWAPLGECWTN